MDSEFRTTPQENVHEKQVTQKKLHTVINQLSHNTSLLLVSWLLLVTALLLGELDHVINPQDSDGCLGGKLHTRDDRINLKHPPKKR